MDEQEIKELQREVARLKRIAELAHWELDRWRVPRKDSNGNLRLDERIRLALDVATREDGHTVEFLDDLGAIEKRARQATKGPWELHPDSRPDIFTVWTANHRGGFFGEGEIIKRGNGFTSNDDLVHVAEFAKYEENYLDGEFLAAARTDIPTLVKEVRRLRALLKERDHDHAAGELSPPSN